jgi:hypothetical protein
MEYGEVAAEITGHVWAALDAAHRNGLDDDQVDDIIDQAKQAWAPPE